MSKQIQFVETKDQNGYMRWAILIDGFCIDTGIKSTDLDISSPSLQRLWDHLDVTITFSNIKEK